MLTFLLLKPAHLQEESWYIFDGIDKIVHLSIFTLLGFLFMIAFSKCKFQFFVQLMLIYAFATEILQESMHMGRSLEVLDVVADFFGICIGYYLYTLLKKLIS